MNWGQETIEQVGIEVFASLFRMMLTHFWQWERWSVNAIARQGVEYINVLSLLPAEAGR
jgi:hypothetical protein